MKFFFLFCLFYYPCECVGYTKETRIEIMTVLFKR